MLDAGGLPFGDPLKTECFELPKVTALRNFILARDSLWRLNGLKGSNFSFRLMNLTTSRIFALCLIAFLSLAAESARAQTYPLLPSPVIPSQRLSVKAASKVKGEEPLSQLYNSGDPSQDEQYYLELLNRARMNPPAAGVEISNTTDPDVSSEFNYWATQDANEPTRASIKSDFATYQPKQPLAMNASLLAAARAHSQDMLDNNYQGHQGTDGSFPADRAQKAGYPSLYPGYPPYVGENAAAYANSVYNAYAGWLIDFGIPNDTQWGHRNNCLEFRGGSDTINPGYTECGPGMIPNPGGGYPATTGPLVSTLDLGDAGKHFILGAVYNDQNKNGRYDPGEGMAGVRIDVAGASYYAVSATQGGYAIPYSGPNGSVTVTASGGAFPTPVTKTIDFEGENVKVDFNPDLTGYPTQVTLVLPGADTIVNADSVLFGWDSVALSTSYHIEIGTDSLLKQKLAINDSGLKNTSFRFGILKDSTTYYWRVQAKNAKGLGPWSAIQVFSTALAPSPVALVAPANNAMVADSDLTLTWRSADKGGYNYWLVVATDKAMRDTVETEQVQDTSEIIGVSNFQPGKSYYWSVAAQNDNGWGIAGAPQSFTVSSAAVAGPAAPDGTSLGIAPNPANRVMQLHYMLPAPAEVTFRFFNSLGQQVKSAALGTRPAGASEYDFNATSLPPGTYSVELMVNGRLETRADRY